MSEERTRAEPSLSLSIVVVTYNPGPILLDCLNSLPQGVGSLPYEVIIVDNASQDGTPEHIAQEFPQIQLIVNKDNRGFATANNQGLALSTGHYMVLLNPDVIAHPNSLAAMVAFLDDNPGVGIVGPRILDGEGRVTITARLPPQPMRILGQFLGVHHLFPGLVYGHYYRACRRAEEPFDAGWVSGACLMLRRAVYTQIGGLDESLFLYGEEEDFCDRAHNANWRVHYLPAASVTHFESSTVSRYVQIKILSHHISRLYYFRKRGRECAVMALKIGFAVELAIKATIRLFQMVWRRGEGVDKLRLRIHIYRFVLGEVWRY